MALAEEVKDEYKTSLADLNFNSKPLINMLTMLAEDHEQHAPEIVKVIEDHIHKCEPQRKLPALYLIDSIMKNLEKSSYRSLFSRNIVQTFTSVFEQVDEKTRASMFKLRQTWTNILPNATLYRIDKKIKSLLDPAWPITATEPEQTSIHVNPRFLQGMGSESERSSPDIAEEVAEESEDQEMLIRQQLIEKQQELLRLKQARLELELAETAEKLRRKPGAKGQPNVASSKSTPLGLPMPSLDDSLPVPVPEIAAKPKDPRPRPTDPRRRDPRLQHQIVSSPPSITGSESIVTSLHGHGTVPSVGALPVVPGSSHSTFPPVSTYGPHSVGQVSHAGKVPFNETGQAFGSAPSYNGLQSSGMPYQPMAGTPQNISGQVFSGEVFIPEESAKFSDDNDSDSSRSSAQSQNNTNIPKQANIRDPRHRLEHKRKDPRVEHRSGQYDRSGNHDRQRNVDRPVQRPVTSVTDAHRDLKDPRIGNGRETQEKRKSKDREMHVPSKQKKEQGLESPRKSSSGQQVVKHRSVSKDRESKSETKLKDSSGVERKWKEQESKRTETKGGRKGEEKRLEKPPERLNREKEKAPRQSSKQYSNKSRDLTGAGDRKTERKSEENQDSRSEHKKSQIAAYKKGSNKTTDKKDEKSKGLLEKGGASASNVQQMDIGQRIRPAKEAEKRLSSDRELQCSTAKKPKLEKPEDPVEMVPENKSSKYDGRTRNVVESMKSPEEQDVNMKEEDMDIESESEEVTKPEIPKIDDDISDLFGGEDEDYRPAVPKHQLPLKSPRSKGWDQFKASQPEQYAYDIELKKQRQDSVIENTPAVGQDIEPQDEDLRVHQPEFQQQISTPASEDMSIPEELAMNHHAEILLKAHRQLKEGQINQNQYQELLKQLGELMHIQKLQEENRRRSSSELLQPQDLQEPNKQDCLSSDMPPSQKPVELSPQHVQLPDPLKQSEVIQPEKQLSSSDLQTSSPPRQAELERNPLREIRSPERPLDTFKIPKKTAKEKADEDERRKELSNLYPESPQEDRYRAHGPFSGRDNQNRHEMEVQQPRTEEDERMLPYEDRHWKENQEGWRATHSDMFDAPPDHRGPRSADFRRSPPRGQNDGRVGGPPENFDGRMRRSGGPPDDFNSRRQRPNGPPGDFDNRRPRPDAPPDDFDSRRPRLDGPPGDFDSRRPRPNGPPDDFESRRPRPDGPQDDFDGRRPRPDGPPGDFDSRPRPDGPPGDFDSRRLRQDGPPGDFDSRPRLDGPPGDFDSRRPRPGCPPDGLEHRWPRESDFEHRGHPERFDHAPNSRGPFRGKPNWPEGQDPDGPPNQRGQWDQDFERRGRIEGDRRGRDVRPETFSGPPDMFTEEERLRPGKQERRDIRRPDMWRDQDDADFVQRSPHDRFPDSRGPPGRFREGRNMDQRRSNEPDDFPPDGRGVPHDIQGRDRGGRPHDRRGGPLDDMRPFNNEEGLKNWDDSRKPRIEGPYGRPGPPVEDSKPWLPPGKRADSPKKEPWRGHPDKRINERPVHNRYGPKVERHDEEEYEPAFIENPKPKPLMSLLDPLPPRPPPGLRGIIGNTRMPGPRGPQRFDGPRPDGPSNMNRQVDTYVDKFGDPRFRCFVDIGPEVSEEVVIGKRNFEIKLGAPPRKIAWGKDFIEVFADPSKRGIVIDETLMYKFGERVKDVTIRGRKEKLFYHGRPLNLWIDGQNYEVRMDAPPKSINIDGKIHKIQVDGRDMMILIDKEEKGRYGGDPRFVFIDEVRKELRFEPPPRHILIDGNPCELKLNMQQPCVNIKGVYHGIRFDGPPRDVFINGKLYQIFTDHAVKIRVGNRFHYVALGGPCHEIIVDGKWFEMKFNEASKEVNVGNQVLMIQLPGAPPEVKILPEIAQEPRPIPPGMQGQMQPGMIPGPIGLSGPRGPNMGPVMPMPGAVPPAMNPMQQPGGPMPGPMPGPQMSIPQSSAPSMPLSGPPMIPGIGQPLSAGAPVTQQSGMPNVLSSLFPTIPATTSASAPIDIKSLFDKLVNTGIIKQEPDTKPVTTKAEVVKPPEYIIPQKKLQKQEEKFEDIPDMTEMDVSHMKSLPVGMVQRLYAGIQCTSCGERFLLKDGEKTDKYRQHLDWHFRQNRKGKTDMKLASCRKWYYPINDWMQYEEVADTKETGKSNFFEQQQQQPVDTTPAKNPLTLVVPEGVSATRCPAATGNDDEDMCNICHEVFEQYWDEELEEWHLRDAIKVNNKIYHPICYEDHTDVSEGTPSPSVLSVPEPGFVSRKSLAYDEASQDGHHASFEEERKISTTVAEPMDTTPTSESSVTSVPIKTEPKDESMYVAATKIKQEPGTEIMSHDQTDDTTQSVKNESHMVVVKQEPQDIPENLSESIVDTPSEPSVDTPLQPSLDTPSQLSADMPSQHSVDTGSQHSVDTGSQHSVDTGSPHSVDTPSQHSADIPSQPSVDTPSKSSVDTPLQPSVDTPLQPSVDIPSQPSADTLSQPSVDSPLQPSADSLSQPSVEIKTEPVEITAEQEIESIKSDEVESSKNTTESQMDCDSSFAPEADISVESKYDNESESAIPEAQKPDTDTQSDPEGKEKEADRVVETEIKMETDSQPKSNTELSTSGIHVSTESSLLAPPEEQQASETQHSPTYSKLSKISLVIPPQTADITPEVFEIGSNASTPTQDELPSPPVMDS